MNIEVKVREKPKEKEAPDDPICRDFDLDCLTMTNSQIRSCFLFPLEPDDKFNTCPMI